jgi:hypothetical protein
MYQYLELVLAFLAPSGHLAEHVPWTSPLVSKMEKWGKLFAAEMKTG